MSARATNALHWCGAALHPTRDALGRTRLRCPDCDGIGEAGASQPTRAITQTPGAPHMAPGVGDPFVRRTAHLFRVPLSLPTPADDAPVPRGVRVVPLTPGGV